MRNMYKFDLERALKGDQVITRDGEKVIEFFLSKRPRMTGDHPVIALVKDKYDGHIEIIRVTKDGKYTQSCLEESNYDLFMATPRNRTYLGE